MIKKILILFFLFYQLININTYTYADEIIYNGTCTDGVTVKFDTISLENMSYTGFDLAKIYKFNVTFNKKDLKYCNLIEKYLTNNPFTGEKLQNKIAMINLMFTPTPYNPNGNTQYINLIAGGTIPLSCVVYQIADVKKNNDRFLQLIVNSNKSLHKKDSTSARQKICT